MALKKNRHYFFRCIDTFFRCSKNCIDTLFYYR